MRLTVSLLHDGEGDPLELLSLYEWLRAEARGADGARVTLGGAASGSGSGSGTMSGTALDVLSIVLSSAFSSASLTVSVMAWRSSRRDAAPVAIEIERDGTVVRIADGSEETASRVLAALSEADSAAGASDR